MTDVITLVTPMDIDALADHQLAEPRHNAVRQRLETDAGALALVQRTAMINADLRALKGVLYRDKELKKALRGLRCRQAA